MIRLAESPARHDLIWLTPAGAMAATSRLEPGDRILVRQWLGRGLPLIRTRTRSDDPPGWLPLGLPLPPSLGKRRLALSAPGRQIERWCAPPLLMEVIESAPAAWREALVSLEQGARQLHLTLRVFGSLAWQHLSGDTYLSEDSDLDLLWCPADQTQLQDGLALLQSWERKSGLRADGEVLLPQGGVAWRELASEPAQVLMKGERLVRLLPLSSIHATLATRIACR